MPVLTARGSWSWGSCVSYLHGPGPPDPAPNPAALLGPLPEALPRESPRHPGHTGGPWARGADGRAQPAAQGQTQPGLEGGPPASGTIATYVTSSLPPQPPGLHFPLCGMGTQQDRLPHGQPGAGSHKATCCRESRPLGASWAGGSWVSADWGALPPQAQPQAVAQACPAPGSCLIPACPPPLLETVWVLLAPEPPAHLPLPRAVAGVRLVLITVVPANPLPPSPRQPPTSKVCFLPPGLGPGKQAG